MTEIEIIKEELALQDYLRVIERKRVADIEKRIEKINKMTRRNKKIFNKMLIGIAIVTVMNFFHPIGIGGFALFGCIAGAVSVLTTK